MVETQLFGFGKKRQVQMSRTCMLAPMVGVADRGYRQLCRSFGAAGVVSEMVSAKGLYYGCLTLKAGERLSEQVASAQLCVITDEERPMGIQLFGGEPEFVGRAVAMVQQFQPDWIDLNMGCPVRKVVSTGAGSALMQDISTAAEIVHAAVRESDVPVTVKIRLGWDETHRNAVTFAQGMEDAGADAITVHGRTREQLYRGAADWTGISAVKQAVKIPVVGNGDVRTAADCLRMYAETGCDMVMIGRGTYGNPFLFREVIAAMHGESIDPPTPEERMTVMLKYIRLVLEQSEKPEEIAIREVRKQASWFLAGLHGAAHLRQQCYQLDSYAAAQHLAAAALNVAKASM